MPARFGLAQVKLAGTWLAKAAGLAGHPELGGTITLAMASLELGQSLASAGRDPLKQALREVAAEVEASTRKMLAAEFGAGWEERNDLAATITVLPAILDRYAPSEDEILAANLDPARIADGVATRINAAREDLFQDGTLGAQMLRITIVEAYRAAKRNKDFALGLLLRSQHEVLARIDDTHEAVDRLGREMQEQLRESVDRLTRDLSLSQSEKSSLTADLARIRAEQNGTVELVAGFLETMVGRRVPPQQFPATLFRLVADWKAAGERIDALSVSRNLSPRLDALKAEAQAAHKIGRLDEATARLAEIRRIESEALDRLEAHEREIREETRLRRIGIAETRAAEAALARVRLDYHAAAEHYKAAARAISPVDAREEWGYFLDAAGALCDLGGEFGDNDALAESIALYRSEALPRAPRERVPLDWATTQNDLGAALQALGVRESGTARLEEAVAAYRAALEERTRERVPLDWAMTENNLGNALQVLGERESGTARLEEAVAACRDALKEYTRERVPLDWATTQNNLGAALQALGARERGTARLEEAVAAFRDALEERTHERTPLQWATTQYNLGTALGTLGERESNTARLEEAVAAYRAALDELTRERVPLDWAATQNNLGNALWTLGEREGGTARLEEAVAAYRAALEERTRERVPLQWAMTQNNLGAALQALGERESGTARLEEAVAAFRAALGEYTRERVPHQWAMTENNLGNALQALGKRENGTARLEEAVAAYRVALEERTRECAPLDWAATQNNLGNALWALGERESGTARLEEAVAAYRAALTELTRERVPRQWATTQSNLDAVLRTFAERKKPTGG